MKDARVKDILKVMWRETKPRFWQAFIMLFFVTLAIVADTINPWVLKRIFDLLAENAPNVATIQIFLPSLIMLVGLYLVSWVSWRFAGLINIYFQPAVMAELAERAFENLLGHSYKFFADTFGGSLVKRVGRLSSAFERIADEVTYRIVPMTVVIVGGIIGLWIQRPAFAVVFILWTLVFLYFNFLASRWAVKADIIRSELDSEAGAALADAVTNAVTIKLFPSRLYEIKRYHEAIWRYTRAQTKSWGRHEVIFAVQSLLMLGIEFGLIYTSIRLWLVGVFTLGDIIFVQSYLLLTFNKLWEVGRTFRHIYDAFADSKEMVEIMNMPHGVQDKRGAKEIIIKEGKIEFKKVNFSFGRRPLLKNFSLTIRPGEKVALVGPSGAGKTTVTKLLFRFYDIQKGYIFIDKQNIANATQDSLREQISLVPQDPILFHRTLMENIRYGRKDATDKEVIEASKKARCHDFISNLSQGYGTYVGERGIKLSGGERQRVAIARAILKNSPILVLDEATSSLDSESESLIQSALHELMQDKTVIVIAHRLSTIMEMDRIIVIEDGKVTSSGTHQELLKEKGTYFKLWNIQAGGFGE